MLIVSTTYTRHDDESPNLCCNCMIESIGIASLMMAMARALAYILAMVEFMKGGRKKRKWSGAFSLRYGEPLLANAVLGGVVSHCETMPRAAAAESGSSTASILMIACTSSSMVTSALYFPQDQSP